MKKMIAILTAGLLAASLAGCGAKQPASYPVEIETPSQSSAVKPEAEDESSALPTPQPGWLYGPVKDLEITESLADKLPSVQNPGEWHRELAFFEKDGLTGVVDRQGNVVVPAAEDVHWCPVCGITNEGETKIFDASGNVIGSGGHDLGGDMPLYDQANDILYMDSYGYLTAWDDVYVASPDTFIAKVVSIAPAADPNTAAYQLADSGEWVDVSDAQGYMLFMPDGTKLDNVVYEELQPSREGAFAAKNAGSWGFISAVTSQQMVPFIYKQVLPFHQNLAAVETEEGWTYVDAKGMQVTAVFEKATTAHDKKAWVKTEDGWGVVNLQDWPA